MTIDRAGNLYGTTFYGGNTDCSSFGCGTVFRMKHEGSGWVLSELYKFSNDGNGANPPGKVVFGADGTLYGNTDGTVFNLRPPATFCPSISCPWSLSVIYGGLDGNTGDVEFDGAGNFYGTTEYGGNYNLNLCFNLGCGTVYQLTRSGNAWVENVLHAFDVDDGEYPDSGVIVDQAGNLYGTAPQSHYGRGTVFQLTQQGSNWNFNELYQFPADGSNGDAPWGGLIQDAAGNLYGTTSGGGANGGGTVFELSSGTWNFNLLYSLAWNHQGRGIAGPSARLLTDTSGNLYGTSVQDGAYGYGSVFKLTPSNGGWTYTSLHDFTGGGDGANPYDGLVMDASGNLYGTTSAGGNHNGTGCVITCGVVFEITP